MFCQSEDAEESPGDLTHRDEEWQENEETMASVERKEDEAGDGQENADPEPADYQHQ